MELTEIKELMKEFAASGLTSLNFSQGETRLVLKKEVKTVAIAPAFSAGAEPVSGLPTTVSDQKEGQVQAGSISVDQGRSSEPASPEEEGQAVPAPLAGVFYRASKPGEEPYVREGQQVKKGQTLGLIEAMKMMSEIPAPMDGTIKSISAENGAFVEYGTTLMVMEEQ